MSHAKELLENTPAEEVVAAALAHISGKHSPQKPNPIMKSPFLVWVLWGCITKHL